jgi:hypothetical protein
MTRLLAALAAFFAILSFALPDGAALAQDGVDGLRLLGRNEDEFAHQMDFHVAGDVAYASVGLGLGFHAYDISDPDNITRGSTVGHAAWRSHVEGNLAYSFAHDLGVQVFDVSGGGAAILVDSYNPPGVDTSYEGGVPVGDRLYVAAHHKGIDILNLNPAETFAPIGRIVLEDNACWNVVESGGYLYVANGRFGLSVVHLSGSDTEVAALDLPGLANDVEVSGDVVFLSLAAEGIASVDVSDPVNPVLLDIAPTLGNAFSMGLVGDVLAVGSYPYLERFDVSDPVKIQRSGWDATLVYAMGADVGVTSSGDTVIVVADWRGMGVYAPEDDPEGDIEVWPARLDFGAVNAATRDSAVIVRNNGAGSLTVSSINTPAGITASTGGFTLGPGESRSVVVSATGPDMVRSTIEYVSNDPDEPSTIQFVYKNNTTFPQMGSVAPDFTLLGTDMQMHSLSDFRGKVVYLEFGASW